MITPQRYWREIPQRYRLEAGKCKKCGKVVFPLRLICPYCKNREFEIIKLSDEGKIVSFTIVRVSMEQFSKQIPYVIAIVELKEGVRLTTQVVDCNPEDIKIGSSVRIVFRKVQEVGKTGVICYGYKCVLI